MYVDVTEVRVSVFPIRSRHGRHFALSVAARRVADDGTTLFAVLDGTSRWDPRTERFEFEGIPSGREEDFSEATTFPYGEAISIAERLAPQMEVNDWTAQQALERFGTDA